MKYLVYSSIVLILVFKFTSLVTYAAEVTFKVVDNPTPQESVTVVEVRLDPKGGQLNALEGVIGLLGEARNITTVLVETGGSVISLWPNEPEYSKEEGVIRFTGGAFTSFPENGLLFRLRIFSEQSSDITLSWLGGSAYKNDGLGTVEPISSRSLNIAVTKSIPNQISNSSPDSSPPYFDFVEVGNDGDTNEGKYFVSFHASDDVSGIDRYEVVEGQITTEVDNGIYVLNDQDRKTKVVLIAYDKAGNSTSIKVPDKYDWLLKVVVGGILLLVVVFVLMRRRGKLKGGKR